MSLLSHGHGRTKQQAHSMQNKGFKHSAALSIKTARPTLDGVQYIATPVADEGIMLYSFADPAHMLDFVERFGAEKVSP